METRCQSSSLRSHYCEDPQVTDHPRTSLSISQTLSGYDLGRNTTKVKDLLCRKIHGGIFMLIIHVHTCVHTILELI